ncbi:MAG: thioredoxin family protein [Candidatus Electryonea clarkiae]|nr:thioredoxin family protein [Candidatus Electryonea clarkiae]MDP8288387.1 thioredoxin family protein [Candidatus Electryonea clarkiae]
MLRNIFCYSLILAVSISFSGCGKAEKKPEISEKKKEEYTLENKLLLGSFIPFSDVKMKNVDNSWVSIDDIRGKKGTLVMITCNHCPYVKAWNERMVDIGNTYSKKDIGVIFINSNDPEKYEADNFEGNILAAKTLKFEFPYVVDATSEIALSFRGSSTPEAFLFDSNGKLVYHGAVDDNSEDASKVTENYLRDALEAVLNGEEIKNKETKAIGCSIKIRT